MTQPFFSTHTSFVPSLQKRSSGARLFNRFFYFLLFLYGLAGIILTSGESCYARFLLSYLVPTLSSPLCLHLLACAALFCRPGLLSFAGCSLHCSSSLVCTLWSTVITLICRTLHFLAVIRLSLPRPSQFCSAVIRPTLLCISLPYLIYFHWLLWPALLCVLPRTLHFAPSRSGRCDVSYSAVLCVILCSAVICMPLLCNALLSCYLLLHSALM